MNILLLRDDIQEGPFTPDVLHARLAEGTVNPDDWAWHEGLTKWQPLKVVLGIDAQQSPSVPVALPPPMPQTANTRDTGFWRAIAVIAIVFLAPYVFRSCSGITQSLDLGDTNISVKNLQVEWKPARRDSVGLDGVLWSPRITATIHNDSSSDLEHLSLRAMFLDEKGTIVGTTESFVGDVPGNKSRGPIFLQCDVGYTSELPVLEMNTKPGLRWRYELHVGILGSDWKKVKSGEIRPSTRPANNGL